MPDLYPKNKAFPHESFEELQAGILKNFEGALQSRGRKGEARLKERFKVFCFKYDLEALILAAEEALKDRLGAKSLGVAWRIPLEDQNHNHPPKHIVEELFAKHNKRYQGTVDAPMILGASKYQDIVERCFQCFKPFVQFLASLPGEKP
jgi:hypothetical protein